MKVAIVYDRVNKFGGAERVLLALHDIFPRAPLYTSLYSKEDAKWAEVFPKVVPSFLNKIKFFQNKHEFLAPLMPFVFSSFNFDEYDLVITVTSEFAKNINVKNKHICYCLTPTRYLWSHEREYFDSKFSIFIKPLINYLKIVDKQAAKKPNAIIAISTVVQKRIKKYYKRDSKIIFPPVNINQFFENSLLREPRKGVASRSFSKKLNKYFLVASRLVKYKKVDLVVKVFNELHLPLVIVGTGREEKKLKKIAKSNIYFAGFVSERELAKYYANAKALIFPQEEDFGITAIEAQSFGVPVIAYKKGGALDSVNSKTGIFFEKQTKADLLAAIERFEKKKFNKKIIQKNAGNFSKEKFKAEFLQFVKSI